MLPSEYEVISLVYPEGSISFFLAPFDVTESLI